MPDLKTTIERAITNQVADPAVLAQLAADAIEGKQVPKFTDFMLTYFTQDEVDHGHFTLHEMEESFDAGKTRPTLPDEAELVEIVHRTIHNALPASLPLAPAIITALRPYLSDGKDKARIAELEAHLKRLASGEGMTGTFYNRHETSAEKELTARLKYAEQALKSEDTK